MDRFVIRERLACTYATLHV